MPYDQRYTQYVYFSGPVSCYDFFGSAVGSIDVDKDGLYDLVVGARGLDRTTPDGGGGFIIFLDWSKY